MARRGRVCLFPGAYSRIPFASSCWARDYSCLIFTSQHGLACALHMRCAKPSISRRWHLPRSDIHPSAWHVMAVHPAFTLCPPPPPLPACCRCGPRIRGAAVPGNFNAPRRQNINSDAPWFGCAAFWSVDGSATPGADDQIGICAKNNTALAGSAVQLCIFFHGGAVSNFSVKTRRKVPTVMHARRGPASVIVGFGKSPRA